MSGRVGVSVSKVGLIVMLLLALVILAFLYIRRIQPRDNYYYVCKPNDKTVYSVEPHSTGDTYVYKCTVG